MKRIISLFLVCSLFLSLGVVFAADDSSGMLNIALGKSITASTQYSDGTAPKYATDGDDNTIYHNGSQEIGSLINGNDVLLLDLGGDYNISRVVVKSRRDLDQAPMRTGWILEAASLPSFKDAVIIGEKPNPGDFKSDLTVNFKEPIKAHYISVRSINDFFCIAEFEVYGEKYAGKVAPVYKDVADKDYNSVQLVYNLGIMSGISQTEFGVDNLMRREEATKIVALSANIMPSHSSESYFRDVDTDNPYLEYINICVEKGIISKGDFFRPRDYIKGGELLKMLEAAMSYNNILNILGTYPQNVMDLATELKMLKDISVDVDSPVSKSDISKIIYNALLTSISAIEEVVDKNGEFIVLYKEGEPLLKKAFGFELNKGIVLENDITSLYEANNRGKNSIVINGEKYYDQNDTLYDYIGQAVYYIYDDENNIISGWENKTQNEVYTIYTKDIDHAKTTKSEIVVADKEGETSEYAIEDLVCVLKNGVAYNDYKKESLDFVNGTIRLIDNNRDDVIDVMHIYEPIVMIADFAKQETGRVFISGLNGESIDISGYQRFKAVSGGKPMDLGDVSQGNLVYAYVSENKENIYVEVSRNNASGIVTKISSDCFAVDGEEFGFSEYYLENKDKTEELYVGMNAFFVLDEHKNLVWIDSVSLGKKDDILGFIQSVDAGQGLESAKIKIYNEKSKFETLEFAEKVTVDGKILSSSEIKTNFTVNPKQYIGNFTLYSINAEGKIRSMDTENYNAVIEGSSKLVDMGISFSDDACRVTDGIYSSHKMVLPIISNFPMFVIPTDTNMVPLTNSEYEMFYNVSTVNQKIPNGDINIGGETRFYGADEFGSPTLGVNLYIIDESLSSIGVIRDVYTDGFVVDSVMEGINSNGDKCYQIVGMDLSEKRKKTVTLNHNLSNVIDSYKIYNDLNDSTLAESEKPASTWFTIFKLLNPEADLTGIDKYLSDISTLNRGDILRIEYRGSEVNALERVFENVANSKDYKIHYSAGDHYMDIRSTFRLTLAEVKSWKKGILSFSASDSSTEIINCKNITGGFYVCTPQKVTKCEIEEIPAYCGENSKIVVITKQGKFHSIICYQE